MNEPRYRLLMQLAMHLDGGFSQLRNLTFPGNLELPTEKIPHRFRSIGSKFVVAFSIYEPKPTDSADDIRRMIADNPIEFFEPTEGDLISLERPPESW